MPEPKRWVWEGDLEAQFAFFDDCITVLEGGEARITRAHVAACADWALRLAWEAEQLHQGGLARGDAIALNLSLLPSCGTKSDPSPKEPS